jgi:hypothetical protein
MRQILAAVVISLTVGSYSQAQETKGRAVLGSDDLIVKIGVAGSGHFVCSAEDSSSRVPVLGRGQSEKEARIVSLQECKRQSNDGFFCKVIDCEQDSVNGSSVSVIFDVVRDTGNISIGFSGNVKHTCYARGWNSQYVAKAPTKTEALALAKSICAYDEGIRKKTEPSGFFCKVDARDCEMIEGFTGSIDIGGAVELFNRFRR